MARLFPLVLLACLLGGTAPADEVESALTPLPADAWTPAAADHLLRRAGFGGTPQEIAALHALGLEGAVDRLLDWSAPDALPAPPITVTAAPGAAEYRAARDDDARREVRQRYQRDDRRQLLHLRDWWMQRMVDTRHPLREKLTLFWHGHFTTSYRDVRNSYHVYIQNTLFRRLAAGNFRELLHGISKDPAMLRYLNNAQNRKARPNENYAREVMELFTLGEGHYGERDIKEAARALTGWTFVGNRFVFNRGQHDDGEKTILGRTGRFDGDQFLDLLLEQPACARHIARRLFRYFAHDEPEAEVIDGLARALVRHDWELRPMLRRLFLSRAFYAGRGTQIKSPAVFMVNLYRSLGMSGKDATGLSLGAYQLGQTLFEPPNVKGWPGGRAWITTSTLLQRYNTAGAVVGQPQDKLRSLQTDRRAMGAMAMLQRGMDGDAGPRRGRRLPPTFDVMAAVRDAGLKTPEAVVDHFTAALLVTPPTAGMRATLLAYLDRIDRQRLHGLLRLIVSTPEFQLT